MRNIYKFTILAFLIGSVAISCRKMITVDSPKTLVSSQRVFSDENLLKSALFNAYYTLDIEGVFTGWLGLYTDELLPRTFSGTDVPEFTASTINSSTMSFNYSTWKSLYSVIYQVNFLLDGLQEPHPELSDSVITRISGESKFLRAFAYFYLVNLWGDVPLITTSNANISSVQARNSLVEVYQQIIKDLKEAVDVLPDNNLGEKVRANKYAALALMARCYLYQQDWEMALEYSDLVVRSGHFSVSDSLPPIGNTFKANNVETIFQLWNESGYTISGVGYTPSGPLEIPNRYIHPSLVESFEVGDKRMLDWLGLNTVEFVNYYYPAKYKLAGPGTFREYTSLLRLSEQYLIRAEAFANMNNLKEAVDDINMIRARAGLSSIPYDLDKNEVLFAVDQERRVEFFCENGHRLFDLKRRGTIDQILGNLKATWKPSAALLPIPQGEINANPVIVQNIGYE